MQIQTPFKKLLNSEEEEEEEKEKALNYEVAANLDDCGAYEKSRIVTKKNVIILGIGGLSF